MAEDTDDGRNVPQVSYTERGLEILTDAQEAWESAREYYMHQGRVSARAQEANMFGGWFHAEIWKRMDSFLEEGAASFEQQKGFINEQDGQIEDLSKQVHILQDKIEALRQEKAELQKKAEGKKRLREELKEMTRQRDDYLACTLTLERHRDEQVGSLMEEIKALKAERAKQEKTEDSMEKLQKEHSHAVAQLKRKVTEARDACDKQKKANGELKSTLAQVMEAKAQLEKEKEEKMEIEIEKPELGISTVSTWHYPPVAPPPPPLLFESRWVCDRTKPIPPPPWAPPKKTYAQAATQTSPPAATTTTQPGNPTALPERYAFVEDMSDYEKEEIGGRKKNKQIPQTPEFSARAVVLHGIPTNWNKEWVAQQTGTPVGYYVGSRWLLNQQRRQGKRTSSLVMYYAEMGSFSNTWKIGGRKVRLVPYDFDR